MNSSFIHAVLLNWAEWHLQQSRTEPGWPSINTIARASMGGRGGIPGHRILSAEMSPDQRRVHTAVMALPEPQRLAIAQKYLGPARNDREHAAALGIKPAAFSRRLKRARRALARLPIWGRRKNSKTIDA